MITAQDVREKTFEKSKFGGYDMAEVDEFLEELADDLTNSQKEISTLKAKMKVLVEKIDEYRSNETALNQSILSAQKLAVQIETEAKAKAEKILADAQEKSDAVVGGIQEKADFEQKRLDAAKAASAKFFDGIRAMCNAQLRNIDNISTEVLGKREAPKAEEPKAAPVAEEAPVRQAPVRRPRPVEEDSEGGISAVEAAVRSIEASVSRRNAEPSVRLDISDDMDAPSFKDSDSTQPFSF